MKQLMVFMAAVAASISLMAQAPIHRVPATPHPIVKEQPNGETITFLLRGDERSHYSMTQDGWQIIENAKGYLCYAQLKRGQVVPSRRMAHNAEQRTKCEQRWLKNKGINKIENHNEK